MKKSNDPRGRVHLNRIGDLFAGCVSKMCSCAACLFSCYLSFLSCALQYDDILLPQAAWVYNGRRVSLLFLCGSV